MLYLDASALVKRYLREPGSDEVNHLFEQGEGLFTSVLSYAEVHAAIGRKLHAHEISREAFQQARTGFLDDYLYALNTLELDVGTLSAVPSLTERHPIRGADAVQLSAALWLCDTMWLARSRFAGEKKLTLVTADERLADFAREAGLEVSVPR